MDYYLTENIIIKDDQMYHINRDKSNKITTKNWHNYLNEYGWSKIPLPWIKQLNKLSIKQSKNRNSCFGVLDCESDGNCFFHCISNALNENNRLSEDYEEVNYKDIRNLIASSIDEETYKTVMTYYKIMKEADDFDEEWDPHEINNIEEFRDQLKESGNNYWCDHILLSIIIKILDLNIFILNSNEITKDYTIYNTLIDFNPNYDSVFLLYEDSCHFKLIGHYDGNKMNSYFKDNIPIELLKLYKLR